LSAWSGVFVRGRRSVQASRNGASNSNMAGFGTERFQ
jgi:hypothetical protein